MFIFKIEFQDKCTESGSVLDVPRQLATMTISISQTLIARWFPNNILYSDFNTSQI